MKPRLRTATCLFRTKTGREFGHQDHKYKPSRKGRLLVENRLVRSSMMSLPLRLLMLASLIFIVQSAVTNPKRSSKENKQFDAPQKTLAKKQSTTVAKKGTKEINMDTKKKYSLIQKKTINNAKNKQSKTELSKMNKPIVVPKEKNLTRKKSNNKKLQNVKKQQEVKKSSKKQPPRKSNAKTNKPMVVKEFPLNEIIFRGRASNEANAFIRTNSKIGKPLELVYERTREQDLNEIEERIKRRFIEYSKMSRR